MANDLFEIIEVPTFSDERGSLTILDNIDKLVDWPVKRSYWMTDIKLPRGAHCVKGERKLYIMAQGSCLFKIFDGINWFEINLTGPSQALLFKADLWRELSDFSDKAVMFTLCNMGYDKDKYIFDKIEYIQYILSSKND